MDILQSAAGLVWGVESGAVDIADLGSALTESAVEDPSLFDAIEAHDLFQPASDGQAHMRRVVAEMLGDQQRSGLWKKVVPRLSQINLPDIPFAAKRFSSSAPAQLSVGTFQAVGSKSKPRARPVLQAVAPEQLQEAFEVWERFTGEAAAAGATDASISLDLLYGITFRWAEFPNENGKRGTIIDFGDATPEQVAEVLSLYRPEWFEPLKPGDQNPDREQETVRFVLTESLSRRMLHWGYRILAETHPDRLRVYQLILKGLAGQRRDNEEETYLRELHRHEIGDKETALGIYAFLNRILHLALGATKEEPHYFNSALGRSLHTLISIIQGTWPIVGYDFDDRIERYRESGRQPLLPTVSGRSLEQMIVLAVNIFGHFGDPLVKIDIGGIFLKELSLIDDPDVVIDFSDLLINLISNAIRYSDPARPLEIKIEGSRIPGGMYAITVTDNGIGINGLENLMKLGTSGFQEGRKRVEGSQGIGLASAAEALQKYGTALWVGFDPSGERPGAQFRFHIPGNLLRYQGSPTQTDDTALRLAILQSLGHHFFVPAAFLNGDVLKEFVALAEQSRATIRTAFNLQLAALHGDNEELNKAFANLNLRNLLPSQFESHVGDQALNIDALVVFAETGCLDAILILDEQAKAGSEEAKIAMYSIGVANLLDAYRKGRAAPEKILDVLKRLIETSGNSDAVIGLDDLEPFMSEVADQRIVDLAKNLDVTMLRFGARTSTEAKRALILLAGAGNQAALQWLDEQPVEELKQEILTPDVVALMERLKGVSKQRN